MAPGYDFSGFIDEIDKARDFKQRMRERSEAIAYRDKRDKRSDDRDRGADIRAEVAQDRQMGQDSLAYQQAAFERRKDLGFGSEGALKKKMANADDRQGRLIEARIKRLEQEEPPAEARAAKIKAAGDVVFDLDKKEKGGESSVWDAGLFDKPLSPDEELLRNKAREFLSSQFEQRMTTPQPAAGGKAPSAGQDYLKKARGR